MSFDRADQIVFKIFEITAPSEYEDREKIMSLVRQFSDRDDILDRLERFETKDLHGFVKALLKVIPLENEREFEDILNGDHEEFPWLPNAKYFKPIDTLRRSLSDVELMVDGESRKITILCYIQVITSVEAYLGDLLKEKVMGNKRAIERLLQNDKDLCKEKISLHKAYVCANYPQIRVEDYLSRLLYHNFEKIIKIYELSLDVDIGFPSEDCKVHLLKATDIRHDLVHRNGFGINGEKIRVSALEVKALIENIELWVDKIEAAVRT